MFRCSVINVLFVAALCDSFNRISGRAQNVKHFFHLFLKLFSRFCGAGDILAKLLPECKHFFHLFSHRAIFVHSLYRLCSIPHIHPAYPSVNETKGAAALR